MLRKFSSNHVLILKTYLGNMNKQDIYIFCCVLHIVQCNKTVRNAFVRRHKNINTFILILMKKTLIDGTQVLRYVFLFFYQRPCHDIYTRENVLFIYLIRK